MHETLDGGQFCSSSVCRGCGLEVLSYFHPEFSLHSGTCGWPGFSPPLSEVRWYSNCDKVITFNDGLLSSTFFFFIETWAPATNSLH